MALDREFKKAHRIRDQYRKTEERIGELMSRRADLEERWADICADIRAAGATIGMTLR